MTQRRNTHRRSVLSQRRLAVRRAAYSAAFETLENRQLMAGDTPIISEFLAGNDTSIVDQFGQHEDYLEVYNPTASPIDLQGWKLKDSVDTWAFPSVTLEAGGYLVVFASGRNLTDPTQPLHTNFKISGNGEYLGLLKPDSSVAFEYTDVPVQKDDVTYGVRFDSTKLIATGATGKYLIPTTATGADWAQPSFNDADWTAATTGIGFGLQTNGFSVKNYLSTVGISDLDGAESVISSPSLQANSATTVAATINYATSGVLGQYGGDAIFPGVETWGDDTDFAMEATGTISFTSTGTYTFGVNSDDGFRLTLTRGTTTLTSEFNGLRGSSDTLAAFNIPQSGAWNVRLVAFNHEGPGSAELFAVKGNKAAFDSTFRLVGDTANGGLTVKTAPSAAQGSLRTDVSAAMLGVNASAYLRIPFTVTDPNAFESLALNMQYDDGFVAYLNGVEIARRNAPAQTSFNSVATQARTTSTLDVERINVTAAAHSALVAGQNVLAIQGLNVAAGDSDFLVAPELIASTAVTTDLRFFGVATPGGVNEQPLANRAAPVTFSVLHGFYDAPQTVALSTATEGATIRYTTNGADPTATTGTVYTGPITISKTTTLRAAAFKPDYVADVVTQTYLFLADVKTQSPNGQTPTGWPGSGVNGQTLDFGMDPNIVNSPIWGPQLDAALKSIPSISIVTPQANLTNSSTGIYVNAGQDGRAWERAASIELIDPNNNSKDEFTIDGGLRIRGGFSRTGGNPKHAFRLFFRDEYGDGKLDFPLFGKDGTDEFKTIDLRTSQNYSWSFTGDGRATFADDIFSHDTQRDMGEPYTRGEYYHLYLNGQYWGVYQTEERANANYAESYFGGNDEDYDVVKVDAGPYNIEATDGSLDAWNNLWRTVNTVDLTNNANYYALLGKNADGTDNPNLPVQIDADNLINYMLVIYYGGNLDAPLSNFLGNSSPNNFFAIRNRNASARQGWQFFAHDAEHTLLDVNEDRLGPYFGYNASSTSKSNPQWLIQQMMKNADFRMRFADLAQKALFNSGVLTTEKSTARFLARAAEVKMATIAESARWGDRTREPPFTQNDWQNAVNRIINEIFPNRDEVFVAQMRSDANKIWNQTWFPLTDAPIFSVNGTPKYGAQLDEDDVLSVNGGGTLYYTLDGSDPRLPGGGINPNAVAANPGGQSTLFTAGSAWKYLSNGVDQGAAWRGKSFNDASWSSGNGQLGYGDGDEATVIDFGPNSNSKYPTAYFRKTVDIPNVGGYASFKLRVLRDDGAVVYVNGKEVGRTNMPQGAIGYSTLASATTEDAWAEFDVPADLLVNGSNVIAVEVHQGALNSSDMSFDCELRAGSAVTVPLTGTKTLNARVLNGADWSALSQAVFSRDAAAAPSNLAITELNYNPHATETALGETAADSNDYEFIEFQNVSDAAVNLSGVKFTAGLDFTFSAGTLLGPGQRGVLVLNEAAFRQRYGDSANILGVYAGKLDNGGETLTMVDAQGAPLISFTYDDANGWPTRPDGSGSTLERVSNTGSYDDPATWRASAEYGGTPGAAGAGPSLDVVVNEIVSNPDVAAGKTDAIELRNNTEASIDISGWYLSDSTTNYRKFRIPDGTILAAGAYLVFTESDFNPGGGTLPNDFGLSSLGERVILTQAVPGTHKLTKFADDESFGPSSVGQSIGRLPNGTGPLQVLGQITLGGENRDAAPASAIVGRQVFYNNSAFDGASDDAAIATDKQALLPGGGGGTFANVTTYTKGLNGIVVDIAGLPVGVTLTAADFGFRTGKTGNRATWTNAPAPASIQIRRGAGANGSDRVVLIWPDYNPLTNVAGQAIANGWLEVTIKATAQTGLSAADVFHFGNLIGETGDATAAAASVAAGDLVRMRNAIGGTPTAAITSVFDFNRDGRVDAADLVRVRNAVGGILPSLSPAALRATPALRAAFAPTAAFSDSRIALSKDKSDEVDALLA